MPPQSDISVIISNLNGAKFLPRLLDTLRGQSLPPREIIVVDRESTDNSLALLRDANVKLLSEAPLRGLGAGYAAGAAVASCPLLFFANEDVWLDKDCLRSLAEAIDPGRNIGAADPWQWTYDGEKLIHAGVRFERSLWSLTSPYPPRRIEFLRLLGAGEKVPFPCAGAFLVHRAAYDGAGGWDESFFLDHEDIDLAIRMWAAGWWTVTCPEAKVFHAVGASSERPSARIVPDRRYRSSFVNSAVVGLKYFSVSGLVYPILNWAVRTLNNCLRIRPRIAAADFSILLEIFKRARTARQFYCKSFAPNAGERFFQEPEFNSERK